MTLPLSENRAYEAVRDDFIILVHDPEADAWFNATTK